MEKVHVECSFTLKLLQKWRHVQVQFISSTWDHDTKRWGSIDNIKRRSLFAKPLGLYLGLIETKTKKKSSHFFLCKVSKGS
jgi:hypothetical protein